MEDKWGYELLRLEIEYQRGYWLTHVYLENNHLVHITDRIAVVVNVVCICSQF